MKLGNQYQPKEIAAAMRKNLYLDAFHWLLDLDITVSLSSKLDN